MEEENVPEIKSPQRISTPPPSSKISNASAVEIVDNSKVVPPSPATSRKSDRSASKSQKSIRSVLNQNEPVLNNEKTGSVEENILQSLSNIEPKGRLISNHVDELTESIKELSKNLETSQSPSLLSNIDKIAGMSKTLTDEAQALRESIKTLSQDINLTKQDLCALKQENVNFPYHLFLIEIIINNINMKCDCFELDYNTLVITASFLGKPPLTLFDNSYEKTDNLNHLNMGKSALFAMTYDKICSIEDFSIHLQLTKKPPCSNCVTNIAEANINYTNDFIKLRDDLCKKWTEEQPRDNILCTTSTPLKKNMCYLMSNSNVDCEPIGIIEVTVRMSFLGKEITTTFSASNKNRCTSSLTKDDNGVSMYSCQDVEMDVQGNVILNEDVLNKNKYSRNTVPSKVGTLMPTFSNDQAIVPTNQNLYKNNKVTNHFQDDGPYNEISTKMNENELRIRIPKTTKIEREGKYDRIQELCECESTPYNTGDQIQFELPKDLGGPDKAQNTFSSNLKYTYKGYDKPKDRKVINVTPSNCPVPVDMQKVINPNKDVFILKIGKKLETKDKKTDLEIEFITPKLPTEPPVENNHISQQCSSSTIKSSKKGGKSKKKKSGKKSKEQLSKKKSKSKGIGKHRKIKK